jgi:hypothetical protein
MKSLKCSICGEAHPRGAAHIWKSEASTGSDLDGMSAEDLRAMVARRREAKRLRQQRWRAKKRAAPVDVLGAFDE